MPRDTRAGFPTFWQTSGTTGAPVLAIHGGLADSMVWSPVADRLAGKFAITAFDQPGHGRSADWDGEADYLTLSAQIAGSFVEEPMHLLGHSFGALTALRLALSAPVVVLSLTLVEPVLFAAARGSPEWDEHSRELAPFVRAMEAGDRETAARAFTALWGTGAPWDMIAPETQRYITQRIHLIPAAAPAMYDDNSHMLSPGLLESLNLPVLILRGTQSPAVIARISDELAERLPDVGIAEIEGAGHMSPVTHPEQVARLIEVNTGR